MEKFGKKELLNLVIGDFNGKLDELVDFFVKVVLRFSYVFLVVIVILNDVFIKEGFSVLLIIKFVMVIKKEDIVLFVLVEKVVEMINVISICVELKLFEKLICVRKIDV